MCQAYDAEWKLCVFLERNAYDKGTKSKRADKNPYHPFYERSRHEQWQLGRRAALKAVETKKGRE